MSKLAAENWILRYYQAIEDGSVTVGRWIRLLYERIISDLENKVYFFDQKKANKAIRFFENFTHHSKGKLAPQLVKLETWQKDSKKRTALFAFLRSRKYFFSSRSAMIRSYSKRIQRPTVTDPSSIIW